MLNAVMTYFGQKPDPKVQVQQAIVGVREHRVLLQKKEEYLRKKINDELQKAKANAISNKPEATAALRRKKLCEVEREKLMNLILQLDVQINTLESANLNAETMIALKKGAEALDAIHNKLPMGKVDEIMDKLQQATANAEELQTSLMNLPGSVDIQEDELAAELNGLEDEALTGLLAGVPSHTPQDVILNKAPVAVEDDEQAQLRELQVAMGM